MIAYAYLKVNTQQNIVEYSVKLIKKASLQRLL